MYAQDVLKAQMRYTAHENWSYWYTATNRLQNAAGTFGSLTYYYDGVGNRTYEILTQGGTTTSVFGYPSDSNRLGLVTQGSTTVRAFTHDGAGNIVADSRSGTAYSYRPTTAAGSTS